MLDRYDLRDVRMFTGTDLQPLLTLEATEWRAALRWDYTQSMELLRGYLDARILPGFVAVERTTGQIRGYCFSVYESQKAVVGDVFSSGTTPADRTELDALLLHHLLPMLQHTPGVDRIEAQLLLDGTAALQPIFGEYNFAAYRRLFMEAELPSPRELLDPEAIVQTEGSPRLQLPGSLRIHRWLAPHYQPAGDLIHRAYDGHGDSHINDQYRTVQGSLRFLHNIVRFPGCGVFDAEHSAVIIDERTSQVEAVALVSKVEPSVAHLTQLCVAPRRRGFGLGRALLRHVATQLSHSGRRALTLTVTEANTSAMKLYTSLGFHERRAFHANVWTKPRG